MKTPKENKELRSYAKPEINISNDVECPVCGALDNDYPSRYGLCLDCFCKALYPSCVKDNCPDDKVMTAVRVFGEMMMTSNERNAIINILKNRSDCQLHYKPNQGTVQSAKAINCLTNRRLNIALEFVREHIGEPLTMKQLCDGFGLRGGGSTRYTLERMATLGLLHFSECRTKGGFILFKIENVTTEI